MSVSEEGTPAVSDSFWDIGQYKRTVKRVDDGLKLSGSLMQLVRERGEIEASYAKELQKWSKKWAEQIEKGPEYGTLRAGWQAPLTEAEASAQLHLQMRQRLEDEVYQTMKNFSKTAYKKNTFGHIKESKDLEESFRKVQKPWAKLYLKVDKCRKEYHAGCRAERTAIIADKNGQNDSTVSPEQQKKLAEKVDRCKDEKEKTKASYEEALRELNRVNPKYLEDMTMVFERSQEMEEKRIKIFREQLMAMHSCLDLSKMTKLPQIYADYMRTLELVDSGQNLKWWEQHHGPAMSMRWPEFEEYSPELRPINKKQHQNTDISDPVLIRNQTSRQDAVPPPPAKARARPPANGYSHGDAGDRTDGHRRDESQLTPSGDEWALEEDYSNVPGVPMRAIHDHEPSEEDEISLHIGDVIDHLEDKDELGWCKGRKNGKVGLYPVGYAEPV